MNSKTKKQFRLCGARNGARKRGEECAQILISNLPGDTTQDEVKKMFSSMRGNIYLDLRSDHGRQAKDKDDAWTRTCHAAIRCSEVSAALKAKEMYDGKVLRRGHKLSVTIKHLHDDLWFWINENGCIDIYAINVSRYEFLSIVIHFDSSIYFVSYGSSFSSLLRQILDNSLIVVIPPSINADNMSSIKYILVCSLCRSDYSAISMDSLAECDVPTLLIFREVNILASHLNSFLYLLPFGIDNDLSDMLLSMDIDHSSIDSVLPGAAIPVLCSQGPNGTFSHCKGGYINSYDFQCPIGTPVIAPRDGIITDITDHHKKHGTDLIFEKKCNYVTILHSDGSQCDLVHLRYKSIQFKKGDYVRVGDLIAYSGNTGFSGEPHIHMMVYVNRLVNDAVHWQSIPIKFKGNKCVTAGYRYTQSIKSMYLDPLLIPSDRIATNSIANWNDIDYTSANKSLLMINCDINSLLYYCVADLSTLQCDIIIVPLPMDYIMNNWCCCRVMRRGGTKLMRELMKVGYDLLHTVGLKSGCEHTIGDNELLIISGYDQLPSKKIMFITMKKDDNLFSESIINDIFAYFSLNIIESCALELPINADITKLERQLGAIRNGLIKYKCKYKWFICAQSLHDLHCYSQYIGAWFPRHSNNNNAQYIPHCPCCLCSANEYGLGKLHKNEKIKLHQEGDDNDSCSGVPDKYLYLKNVYKAENKRKRKRNEDNIIKKKKNKINIFDKYNNNIININCHLLSLIAQQWQLDLHTQRCLLYQQFQRWRYEAKGKNIADLVETHKEELHRLQMLRTMQYTQQIDFQKSKKNDRMIIAEKHGVVGSKDHMNCIPLTPTINNINPAQEMIKCIAPKRKYYQQTISQINLNDCGFAQINQIIYYKEQQRKLQMQQQLQQHLHIQQMRIRQIQQQQQLQNIKSVNADNFKKIQNIINMIVKNKMAFCAVKITSSQHAIHHVTNCQTCMQTLERAKGTLFK